MNWFRGIWFDPVTLFPMHIYIIGHNNPSVRIIDLTPLMLCVLILYISGETYSLNSISNDRFLFSWETYHGNYICSQSFCQKSAERKSPKKYFSYLILMSGFFDFELQMQYKQRSRGEHLNNIYSRHGDYDDFSHTLFYSKIKRT